MAGPLAQRRRPGGRFRPMSEINVTPLVDVMLVLLIIFMITAPLLTVGVPVDLPKTQAATMNEPVEPVVITVDGKGALWIQETSIEQDALVPRLQAILRNKADQRVYVRGDKGIHYGRVMEVMGMVAAAGFDKVALIAEMPQGQAGAASGRPSAARPPPAQQRRTN